jgi:hypothetical protein
MPCRKQTGTVMPDQQAAQAQLSIAFWACCRGPLCARHLPNTILTAATHQYHHTSQLCVIEGSGLPHIGQGGVEHGVPAAAQHSQVSLDPCPQRAWTLATGYLPDTCQLGTTAWHHCLAPLLGTTAARLLRAFAACVCCCAFAAVCLAAVCLAAVRLLLCVCCRAFAAVRLLLCVCCCAFAAVRLLLCVCCCAVNVVLSLLCCLLFMAACSSLNSAFHRLVTTPAHCAATHM